MNGIKATIGNPNILRKPTLHPNYYLGMEKYYLARWMQHRGGCYFFFDGALMKNPGVDGARGIIINLDEQKEYKYAWGLGHATNNHA